MRPHARKVAGVPLAMAFDSADAARTFTFSFRHLEGVRQPTELFVPRYQYPHGVDVAVSDGEWRLDAHLQTLFYTHGAERVEHTITLRLPRR